MGQDEASGLRARGRSCYEKGDMGGALEAYGRLHELEPQNPEVLNDLGTIFFALGKSRESERCYVRALKLDPHHAEAGQNLRMLCRATGASVEAVLKRGEQWQADTGRGFYDVTVVVPVHSEFGVFDKCLDALYSQSFAAERYEVIAVANGVSRPAAEELRELVSGWRQHFGARLTLCEVEPASIALARNEGVERSQGRIVLQTNADAVLSRTALAQHYAEHEEFGFDPMCVVAGGRKFPDAYLRSLFNYLYEAIPLYTALHLRRPRFLADYNWFVTCNLSSLREAYDRFGTYDASFIWGSDQELGMRWERQGARIYADTSIEGYHLHWLSFDFWKSKCIEATPHWFRRHMGMAPEELPLKGREAVRAKLDAVRFDPAEVEREIRRVEASFAGPEQFRGEMVMGVYAAELEGFTACLRRLLADYRNYLKHSEVWKRIEHAVAAPETAAQGREAV